MDQQRESSSLHGLLSSRYLWFILCLALVLRIAAAYYWHRQASPEQGYFRLGDSDGYWVLAEHIARGEPYQYGSENASVFRAPLMPLWLSSFTRITDRSQAILSARVAGAVLGTICVLLIALLANRLGGRRAAMAAASVATVFPSAIGMSIVVLSEALFVPLMLVHLLLLHSAYTASSTRNWAILATLAGLICGLAILTRPSWLLFVPFFGLLGLLASESRKRHCFIAMLMITGIATAMTPWWIRNYKVTGKFVLTTLQVGPSLLDAFHEGASGGSDEGMQFMRRIEAEQINSDRTAALPLEGTLEWRINRRAQQQALEWAGSHPWQVLNLCWAKFRKTWSLWPDGGDVGSLAMRLAISGGSFAVVLLSFVGSWQNWRVSSGNHDRLRMLAICWSPCLYFTGLHMVFVGSVRYREPALLVLVAVAGCAVARIFSRFNVSTEESSSVDSGSPDRSTG